MNNSSFLQQTAKPDLAKRLILFAWIVTVVVLVLVGLMRRVSIDLPEGWDLHFLVPFHATVNALTAITLIIALLFIKQRNFVAHRNTMTVALVLSAIFLLSYVAYHFTNDPTIYGDLNSNGILEDKEKAQKGGKRKGLMVMLQTNNVMEAVIFKIIFLNCILFNAEAFV